MAQQGAEQLFPTSSEAPLARAGRYQLGETSVPIKFPDVTQINVANLPVCSTSPKLERKLLGIYYS